MSDAAAFLLFVLSGAFIFLYRCHYTSYLAARTEGRQLLFRVGAAAACLVILARALLWAGESLISDWGIVGKLWSGVSIPFDIPLLRVYVTAFVLGPVLAYTVNLFYRADTASTRAIERYGTEQEKLLFKAMQDSSLASVTLESRKVYIGWPVYSPDLRHETNDFRLLPALSGYRKEDYLSLDFTTQYLDIYDHIESEVIGGVRAKDFEIVLPLEKVVSVNRFELDIDQELFRLP